LERKKEGRKEGKFFVQKSPEISGVPMGTSEKNPKKKIKKFPFFLESFTIRNLDNYSLKNGVSVMDKEVDNVYKKYRGFLLHFYETIIDLFFVVYKYFCYDF
jgi:hypothetical protein